MFCGSGTKVIYNYSHNFRIEKWVYWDTAVKRPFLIPQQSQIQPKMLIQMSKMHGQEITQNTKDLYVGISQKTVTAHMETNANLHTAYKSWKSIKLTTLSIKPRFATHMRRKVIVCMGKDAILFTKILRICWRRLRLN